MIAAGQSIGNYRVLAKIGTGGMGAVYLAEHPLIGKKIALKVIHRELAGNKEVVQRFFQEARAVNKIGNEHIVEIHDFGVTPEGDNFYIMEYLEGRTLASVLAGTRPMEPMRALHVGAQIASALAAAHASGVIHRDLKPDNIMLMSRLGDPDFVKVLDFGLAKMFAASDASAVQTAAGVLLGTPQYMSPEACESKRDVDHRTDIYALGILLFQMMTGVLPFDGGSMGEVLVKQVTALPPAPRGLNPAIPPAVEQVLLRCLAKPVDARFPTMQALRDALLDPDAYLRGSPPMQPARSVAPGEAPVDARAVRAHAAAAAGNLPLPAPNPSLVGGPQPTSDGSHSAPGNQPVPGLALPAEPKMHTMRIATPLGYSSRPPRKVWPVVLVIGLLAGLGGGAFAVAWFGRGAGSAGPGSAGLVAASAANAGAGDVGAGAAGSNGAGPEPTAGSAGAGQNGAGPEPTAGSAGAGQNGAGPAATTGSAGAGSAVGRGAPAAADAGVDGGKLVKITIESAPNGASVLGATGELFGKTPLALEIAASDQSITFVLKLRGYLDKVEEVRLTGNTMTKVQLVRIPSSQPSRRPRGRRGQGTQSTAETSGNGLERPE